MNCLNLQGVCSADHQFLAVAMKHVGSTNDTNAFETCSLKPTNESLLFLYHWNGDPAYTLTSTMMVPFPGTNLHVTAAWLEYYL